MKIAKLQLLPEVMRQSKDPLHQVYLLETRWNPLLQQQPSKTSLKNSQHTIIEELDLSETQDASNEEEIQDDELPLIEPIESILSSVSSVEDETQAVNVKSMVDAFELRGKEEMHGLSYRISGNSDQETPPQVLFNLLGERENEMKAHTHKGSSAFKSIMMS